ncbi:MAG: hypothetical protein MJ110_07215, partial [Lachnospiraceae bacterium]|nr:hypothetical protein [Lachnospiraceae bacterium]
MLAFIALFLFGLALLVATIWYFKDVIREIFNIGERKKSSSEQEDTIKDAEYRPVKDDTIPKSKPEPGNPKMDETVSDARTTDDKARYTPGSYEKVELHLSSGVDYIEYIYYDENDNLIDSAKAVKCKIRECSADGTVLRELWGKPYKNHITEHIKD